MEIITPQDYRNKARTRRRCRLRPCDACRKRKTRCVTKDSDGDCVHCQLRATACTFQYSPPKRQATTGAYGLSGDEPAPGLDDPSLQDGQSPSRSFSRSHSRSREESRDEVQVLVSEMQSPVQSFLSPAETRASGNSSSQYLHQAPPSVIAPELVKHDPDPLERTLGCAGIRPPARTCREQDTVTLFAKARPLIDMLTNWHHSIPPTLQMNIIYQHDRILSDIRQIALQTAQSAISFVTNLRPDHLEAFWYFTSPYLFSLVGSFTTLLLVTSLSSQERHFWQETLNSYLWNLRMMSKSHIPMQYAVNRLEGAILRGLEYALAVNLIEPLNCKVSLMVGNYASDVYEYTDFGDWGLAVGNKEAYDLLSGLAVPPDPMMPR
ncbi:hypothetical protein EDB81DRAFT_927035 [Dactylonectria macrodidyma]|uniref:Zn(2)-C6 fungal-type domain-containing protein n=1 Tax=Dactylonectria macrodidyma TaxID=307937 RepID=A0A9P9D0Y6_9HYPO|nr:hypothetical protein EDB81DRAFT_927035 [Dactylonectria macrodidyma]